MLDVLYIAPVLGITVLQPDEGSSNVSWNMFGVVNDHRLFAPSWHEDLDSIIVIAVSALIERALNAQSIINDGTILRQATAPAVSNRWYKSKSELFVQ